MQRPDTTEYAEYYGLYVNQVPDGDVMEILGRWRRVDHAGRWRTLPAESETYRYEPGKWSVRRGSWPCPRRRVGVQLPCLELRARRPGASCRRWIRTNGRWARTLAINERWRLYSRIWPAPGHRAWRSSAAWASMPGIGGVSPATWNSASVRVPISSRATRSITGGCWRRSTCGHCAPRVASRGSQVV